MNLLCPNCQKMLTVPEQFAGQLMKCPLCAGTFNVPGLPAAAPPPEALAPQPALALSPPPAAPAETYGLQHEPAASPPALQLPPPGPTDALPPPATVPSTPELPPEAPSPSPSTIGYKKTRALYFNPRVLQWLAPAALLLVFFLQFFPWVGIYPGGVAAVTQNAWQAAFNSYTPDGDLEEVVKTEFEKEKMGVSTLTIFYLLLFIPTLLITLACPLLTALNVKLPAALQGVFPWRWGIAAALNLFVLLFLGLQLVVGFSIESIVRNSVEKQLEEKFKTDKSTKSQKMKELTHGMAVGSLTRTWWLTLAVVLHLVALLSAAILSYVGHHPNRPTPRLALEW